jgi:plastocyanin
MSTRKLLPLAFALAIVGAACAEPPNPEPQFGSGQRFVTYVADPLNDAGIDPSVVVNGDGLPIVSYFSFEEEVPEGQLPETRPVGSPTLPGVMATTVNADGVWSRGALALQAEVPSVDVPFAPGVEEAVADLAPDNVTGLEIVADGETLHAAWGSRRGLYYATGSTDPSSTTPVSIEQVGRTPPIGLSLAVVNGTPWIGYYTSMSETGAVEVATPEGGGWRVDGVADAAGCATCRTAVIAADGGPAVAYSDAGAGVSVATNDGENGWVSFGVGDGGQGLAGAATGDGIALSYYDGEQVTVATGSPTGPFDAVSAATVGADAATTPGAGTSVAADEQGGLWLGWFDEAEGVGFASGDGTQLEPIDTGAETADGAMPSVAVTPDASTAYLAWRDIENQDLLVAAYGEVEELAIAAPSPELEPQAQETSAPPAEDCAEAENGVVNIVAQGVQFDVPCFNVPAGEPFTIAFDNQDAGQPHNVAIYPSADEISPDAALLQGDIITGPDQIEYQVDALDAGTYYFQCDVHPQMNGTVNVGEGGGGTTGATGGTGTTGATGATGATGETGGDGGGGALTVTAVNIAFDTDTIEIPAGEAFTITFDNQDAGVQHNIAIYRDDTLAEVLFRGTLVTGPDTVDYAIDPLEAGTYYFHCDVHPNMNGTVVVA